MTFRLRPSDNAIVTVTVTWNQAGGPGPLTFQLRTRMAGDVLTVDLVDPVAGEAFIDADIRSTSPTGHLPTESAIRRRANEFRAKRKAEIDVDKYKAGFYKDGKPRPGFAAHQEPHHRPLPESPLATRPSDPRPVHEQPHRIDPLPPISEG